MLFKNSVKTLSFFSLFIVIAFSQISYSASESGHSDLMQLLSMIYGLNPNVAEYLSTGNQSMDDVPFTSATQSGSASKKIHFASTATALDIDESTLDQSGHRKIQHLITSAFTNTLLGGRTASLGNAETTEMFMHFLQNGDALGVAMATHAMVDTMIPFHAGYKGALTVPIIVDINIPIGHLTDGKEPDRLTPGKIIIAMMTMGNYFIALREIQRGIYGVNEQWLSKLEKEGVDIQNNMSIIKWFSEQPIVQSTFKDLPARNNRKYLEVMLNAIHDKISDNDVFLREEDLEKSFTELKQQVFAAATTASQNSPISVHDILEHFFKKAWDKGLLNEPQIIKDVFAQSKSGATRLNELIVEHDINHLSAIDQFAILNELKAHNFKIPWSTEWMLTEMANNYSHKIIKPNSSHFDSSHLHTEGIEALEKIEADAINDIQKNLFGMKTKYVFNPMVEFWRKVFQNWAKLTPEQKGNTLFKKIVAASDVIVNTVLAEDHHIKTLREEYLINRKTGKIGLFHSDKLAVFFKAVAFIFNEGIRRPMTTAGNLDLVYKTSRKKYVKELRNENPDGIFSEENLSRSAAYNEYINRKYNNPNTPTGVVQKTANWIIKNFDNHNGSRLSPVCSNVFMH